MLPINFPWKLFPKVIGLVCLCLIPVRARISFTNPLVLHENGDNLETPVVGSKNDVKFGYSLAFSSSFGPGSSGSLFIGAVNETRATKNSGVIWQCELSRRTQRQFYISCSVLTEFSNQPISNPTQACFSERNKFYLEKESERWIGASLAVTNSGGLLACAPRTKLNGGSVRSGCSQQTRVHGMCYFMAMWGTAIIKVEPIKHSGINTNHMYTDRYDFGFSLSLGTSREIFLGGAFNDDGRGGVFKCPDEHCRSPIFLNPVRHDYNDHPHLGYSITNGRRKDGTYFLAAGAPRANDLVGAVKIYNSQSFNILITLTGEQLGSRFGHVVLAVDLNGDGYEEVLIGSPLYSPDLRKPEVSDSGCVYIYDLNKLPVDNPVKLSPNGKETQWTVSPHARFGTALADAGDINADGTKDVAASAPYDDQGIGTVFIFYGQSNLRISKPDETIRGKVWTIPNLKGFGTALLGDQDFDQNGTPDLAASSFESGHVILLRSRPILVSTFSFEFFTIVAGNRQGPIFNLLPTQESLFAKTCITFNNTRALLQKTTLDIWIKFSVGLDSKFLLSNHSHQAFQRYSVTVLNGKCFSIDFRLAKPNDQDVTLASHVELSVELVYNQTSVYTMDVQTMKVNYKEESNVFSHAGFQLVEPDPVLSKRASSRLDIAADTCTRKPSGEPDCKPQLFLAADHFYQLTGAQTIHEWHNNTQLRIGELHSFTVVITLGNRGQTAYNPSVFVKLSLPLGVISDDTSPVSFSWISTPGKSDACATSPQANLTATKLECRQLLHSDQKMKFILEIGNLKSLKVNRNGFLGNIQINVSTYPKGGENLKFHTVSPNYHAGMTGDVNLAIEVTDTKRDSIDWKRKPVIDLEENLILRNKGFSGTMGKVVKIEFLIPTHLKVGSTDVPLLHVVNPSSQLFNCRSRGFEFYHKFQLIENYTFTHKESSIGQSVANQVFKFLDVSTWKLEGCPERTVCNSVICVGDVEAKSFVELELHLKLLPEITEILQDSLLTDMSVEILTKLFYSETEIREYSIYVSTAFNQPMIPFWVYIVSMAGGLLLLGLTTYGLFKCGFFRRETKQKLDNLRRQTYLEMDANVAKSLQDLLDSHQD